MKKYSGSLLTFSCAIVCVFLFFIIQKLGEPGYRVTDSLSLNLRLGNISSFGLLLGLIASLLSFAFRITRVKVYWIISSVATILFLLSGSAEIIFIYEGISTLDFPEGESIWLYAPRLSVTLLALSLALLNLSAQSAYAARLR